MKIHAGFFCGCRSISRGGYGDLVFSWAITVDKCQLHQNLSIYRIFNRFLSLFYHRVRLHFPLAALQCGIMFLYLRLVGSG